jgi:hypothetical protein
MSRSDDVDHGASRTLAPDCPSRTLTRRRAMTVLGAVAGAPSRRSRDRDGCDLPLERHLAWLAIATVDLPP